MRTGCEPADVVAIVYNGADRGVGEALQHAKLLALSPVMRASIGEVVAACSEQFDGPDAEENSASGGDLEDWYAH